MTVTAITPQKRRPDRFSIFVDGAFAFGIPGSDLVRYALSQGMEITRERLDYLLEQVVFVNARDTALRYLGSRARSYREIVKRLESDEYPPEVINRVMALMTQYRYVNDRKFARDYAESRLRYGHYGAYRVKRELKEKGIATALIDDALRHFDEDNLENNAALDWLKRKQPDTRDPAQRKRCINALLRRGYSYAVINEALAAHEGAMDE